MNSATALQPSQLAASFIASLCSLAAAEPQQYAAAACLRLRARANLGSALFGATLLFLVSAELADRTLLVLLGGGLIIVCLMFVRNLFGFVAGLLLVVALVLAGFYLEERYVAVLLALLALQTALSALDSVVVLMRISLDRRAVILQSDAQLLAQYTGIPALLWALTWCAIAVALIVVAVTLAYQDGTALHSTLRI